MSLPHIKLVGHLDVPADRWDDVLEALELHIDLTRAEAGCIEFNVSPSETVNHRLLVSELFTDQSSFDAHQSRTKASDWSKVSAGIDRKYEIVEIPA